MMVQCTVYNWGGGRRHKHIRQKDSTGIIWGNISKHNDLEDLNTSINDMASVIKQIINEEILENKDKAFTKAIRN